MVWKVHFHKLHLLMCNATKCGIQKYSGSTSNHTSETQPFINDARRLPLLYDNNFAWSMEAPTEERGAKPIGDRQVLDRKSVV